MLLGFLFIKETIELKQNPDARDSSTLKQTK